MYVNGSGLRLFIDVIDHSCIVPYNFRVSGFLRNMVTVVTTVNDTINGK